MLLGPNPRVSDSVGPRIEPWLQQFPRQPDMSCLRITLWELVSANDIILIALGSSDPLSSGMANSATMSRRLRASPVHCHLWLWVFFLLAFSTFTMTLKYCPGVWSLWALPGLWGSDYYGMRLPSVLGSCYGTLNCCLFRLQQFLPLSTDHRKFSWEKFVEAAPQCLRPGTIPWQQVC